MDEIVLSIIIPVYNVEKYLPECMDRILPQINDTCEIILVNDGSTDDSELICKKYCSDRVNVKCITQANKGLSGARNTGINAAKGDYLMLLDSDDYLADGSISIILDFICMRPSDIFLIRARSFEDGKDVYTEEQVNYSQISSSKRPIEVFSELNKIDKFWFAAWLVISKREFIIENGLFFKEGIFHEDELWVPLVFSKAKSIGFINECLYCYRNNRTGSIINQKSIKKQTDLMIVMKELEKESDTDDIVVRKVFKDRCAAIIWGRILDYKQFESIDDDRYLINSLTENLYLLKHDKYKFLYYVTKSIGIRAMSSLALIGRRKNEDG